MQDQSDRPKISVESMQISPNNETLACVFEKKVEQRSSFFLRIYKRLSDNWVVDPQFTDQSGTGIHKTSFSPSSNILFCIAKIQQNKPGWGLKKIALHQQSKVYDLGCNGQQFSKNYVTYDIKALSDERYLCMYSDKNCANIDLFDNNGCIKQIKLEDYENIARIYANPFESNTSTIFIGGNCGFTGDPFIDVVNLKDGSHIRLRFDIEQHIPINMSYASEALAVELGRIFVIPNMKEMIKNMHKKEDFVTYSNKTPPLPKQKKLQLNSYFYYWSYAPRIFLCGSAVCAIAYCVKKYWHNFFDLSALKNRWLNK